jgi:hypothetical protein
MEIGLCGGHIFRSLWGRKRNFIHHWQEFNSLMLGRPDSISSRSARCLWWTKWQWDRFFSEYCGSPPVSNIPPMFHNHLVNTARITKRTGPSLGSIEYNSGHSDGIREHWTIEVRSFASFLCAQDNRYGQGKGKFCHVLSWTGRAVA